jgi:uncharacterized protein
MRQIEVSALRQDIFQVLNRLSTDGPVEIVRHGKVVATLGAPPRKALNAKPKINPQRLKRLCRRHRIQRLALFGSILRDDFGPDSDVDILIDPVQGHMRTLGSRVAAQEDLEQLFGRRVDLVKRSVIEAATNEIRRRSILDTARVIYDAS